MQALSSYNPASASAVERALDALQDESLGFSASPWYSKRGLFAPFVWPDWPEHLKKELTGRIDAFHRDHPELQRVAEGTPEWQAVFRDWRTDPESVCVIAAAFSRHFPGRVEWVYSQRDSRGRIEAHCMVKDLPRLQQPPVGTPRAIIEATTPHVARPVFLELSWRNSMVGPPGPLSEADRHAFQASAQEVFEWASSRIRPILDALHNKLKALYRERFRGLYVFGSYARPDAGIELPENSDLDVALVLSDFTSAYDEIKRFGDITYDLSLEHSLVISLVPIREVDYREGRTNFTRMISSYAIPVK